MIKLSNSIGILSCRVSERGDNSMSAPALTALINKARVVFLLFLIGLLLHIPHAIAADSRNYKKPEDVVAWLYRDFAFDAIMRRYWNNASLIEQPKKVLRLYFTEEMASLITKDRKCVKETHEICRLDFDPIFASQDPEAVDLTISPADQPNTVRVQFRYPGNGELISLAYQVQKTGGSWRIRDIVYADGGSLRKLLGGQK